MNANQRMHWAARARLVKEVRLTARLLVRAAKVAPPMGRLHVRVAYRPRDRRRRDVGNLWPTHKALLDGVVDAGLVPDDTPEFVVEGVPEILPVDGSAACLWLVLGWEV